MGDPFTVAVDVRYLTYGGATLFGDPISEGGLGWEGIFALAVGAQFQINDGLTVQVGYEGNENPIPDVLTLFNVQLPVIGKHVLSGGLTMRLADNLTSSLSLSSLREFHYRSHSHYSRLIRHIGRRVNFARFRDEPQLLKQPLLKAHPMLLQLIEGTTGNRPPATSCGRLQGYF